MTFTEKQTDPTAPTHWRGDMQADYFYANGVAGDKFFKHLKQNDSFLASKCPECNKIYCPPRMYCEDCFVDIPDSHWKQIPATGTIRLFTIAKLNAHGKKLDAPKVMALIDVDQTDGAMLGVINTTDLEADLTDKKVKAVLKPQTEREGTLKDIRYWQLL
ncbi:MAG: nucleic acid-binding protein [Candidatus Lokiarchaeota archaeon]|nr:nucleic acid-binding protein [Candidatus Lokiarchaeota archaeon]